MSNAYAIRDALRRGRDSGAIQEDLRVGGELLLRDLQTSLNTPYPPPSAPGEAPHRRTGALQASYLMEVSSDGFGGDVLEFASRDKVAVYLELGTRYMRPRPHLRPMAARSPEVLRPLLTRGIETREARI